MAKKAASAKNPVKKSAKNPVKKTGAESTPKKKSASSQPAKAVALTAAKAEHALSFSERTKIKKLLRTKTLEPVSLGLTLLESTAATRADWEAIFTPQIFTSLLISWVPEIWELVAKSLESYPELSTSFQTLALERCRKCPSKHAGFDGLLLARKAVCRPAFVKRWSASENPRAFMEFISIPAGSFTMGSPETEEDRGNDEKQVPVTITRAFELGKTVVTQKQWAEVMGTDPWNWEDLKETGDNYPAVFVSWLDASLFCEHLTSYERDAGRLSEKQTYRLPTEAEWEYACRAGTTTAYSYGDDESKLDDYAWYKDNSGGNLNEVATKKPNPWGLFDMHGNVWEWCEDWHEDSLSGGDDPKGPSAGSGRVLRGGNWYYSASYCRSARRFNLYPTCRRFYSGFRIVRVLL